MSNYSLQLGILTLLLATFSEATLASTKKSSSIIVSETGELLVNVNIHTDSVSLLSLDGITEAIELEVGRAPQAVSFSHNSEYLFVTNRDDNSLSILGMESQSNLGCVNLGSDPFGIVADDRFIYVSNQGSNSISVISQNTMKRLFDIEVDRAPKGLTLDLDNQLLYVTHFFSGSVSVVNTEIMSVIENISNIGTANISQSLEISLDGKKAFLPHTLSNSTNQALIFDNTVFPVVSVLDLEERRIRSSDREFLDIIDQPVGLPIDAELMSSGALFVANAASNDISIFNTETGSNMAHLEVGSNPRGLALSPDENFLYVNNTLDGTVSIIDTSELVVINEIESTIIDKEDPIHKGKVIFNSSNRTDLARDQWISCATCHFDGEHDGRTWFFSDGPRNTPSLLGLSSTSPFHWSGDLNELQDVELTIRNIQAGTGLAEGEDNCDPACNLGPPNSGRSADLDDLANYMLSLDFRTQVTEFSELNRSVFDLGESVFSSTEASCSSCHIPSVYTDQLTPNVGTGTSALESKGFSFDTPMLLNLSTSAPYLHDGSAASLNDLLTNSKLQNLHGKTTHLSNAEIEALVYYLENLPNGNSIPAVTNECIGLQNELVGNQGIGEIKLSLNSVEFTSGAPFKLDFHFAGYGQADIYIVVQFPDGQFQSIDTNSTLGEINQLIKHYGAKELDQTENIELVNIATPTDLPGGNYTIHGLLTVTGSDPFTDSNWISYDQVEFEIK
jgi:YVTN family beta-propeller protein